MVEEISCWSCGKSIEISLSECPNCGMPQDKKSSEEEDLDFLDDLLESSSSSSSKSTEESDTDDIVLPDFDYIDGKTDESSSPRGEMDAGYGEPDEPTVEEDDLVLPDFDYIDGKTDESSSPRGEMDAGYGEPDEPTVEEDDLVLPDFDYIEGKTAESSSPVEEIDEGYGEHEDLTEEIDGSPDSSDMEPDSHSDRKQAMLADMDSLLEETPSEQQKQQEQKEQQEPSETTLDEMHLPATDMAEIQEEEEFAGREEMQGGLTLKTAVWLFSSQNLYWGFVYTVLVFGTYRVENPNFSAFQLSTDDFSLTPIAFFGSWLIFFVMGWFYGYKLRRNNISPGIKHGVAFLVLNLITMVLISEISLMLLNPEGTNPENYLLSSYFMILPIHYLATAILAGYFIFFLGFLYLWDDLYRISPMYKLEPSLTEL